MEQPIELWGMNEEARRLRISRRRLQDLLKDYPFYRTVGRRKLFTPEDHNNLVRALPCPLKIERRKRSPNWFLRGTVRGITVRESTGTSDRDAAEEIRIKREAELLKRSVHGARSVATFLDVAVAYMKAGGERRYISPLLDHFGAAPLIKIDQAGIDRAATLLKPKASGATCNRQIYTPMSAILKHAA